MSEPLDPSAKLRAGFDLSGGRHYRRPGLGAFGTWVCPTCAAEQNGDFTKGCTACGAGVPGTKEAVPPVIPNPYAPRRATSPLLAQAAPASGTMKREELLRELRQIVREELQQVFAPPPGQLTLTQDEAYALRTGIEFLQVAMEGATDGADPRLPDPVRIEALSGQLYLIESGDDPTALAPGPAFGSPLLSPSTSQEPQTP